MAVARKRKIDPTGRVDLLARGILKELVRTKVNDPVLKNLYLKWEPQINLCLSDLLRRYNVGKQIREIRRVIDASPNA